MERRRTGNWLGQFSSGHGIYFNPLSALSLIISGPEKPGQNTARKLCVVKNLLNDKSHFLPFSAIRESLLHTLFHVFKKSMIGLNLKMSVPLKSHINHNFENAY